MSSRLVNACDQIAYWQPSRRWMQFWSGLGTFFERRT